MKQAILKGNKITKQFAEATLPILDKVNIELYDGDFTIVMGASGAGKSTLLYALSGMSGINEGSIIFQNKDIVSFTENQMARLRSEAFGFVFQQTHLVSNLTLFENVTVAGYLNKKRTTVETDQRAKQLLKQMNVENVMNRLPSNVSGGEAQRAALARAIINEPTLIFADEPTGALNRKNSDEVLNVFQKLHEQGQSILMVTHDMHAAAHGNRIIYLEDGKVLAELDLSMMHLEDMRKRESKVSKWLASFMW